MGIIAKFLQHLRIEFDVCYLQQKCILPGYYLPATYHYSLIIFSDSAYSNIPARLSNSISISCLTIHCSYIVISSNSKVQTKLLTSQIHNTAPLNISTLDCPIYHLTRPKINYFESDYSGNFVCFISQHLTYQPLLS